jgi:hypothetical protein
MKTLIESTDTSATYQLSHDGALRTITLTRPEDAEINPDFQTMAEQEHARWLSWLNQ